jgi:excisionase family DNA binding protein
VAAMKASPNELVLPRADGAPFQPTIRHNLVDHLRRALVTADVVIGFEHNCRRCKGKVNKGLLPSDTVVTWRHDDKVQRTCPNQPSDMKKKCGMKLWIKALPRPLRFYDLRHTHATLLRRGGADPGAVQKALGHSDPRITAQTYDHTELEEQRALFERVLAFGRPADGSLGAPVVRETKPPKNKAPEADDFSNDSEGLYQSGRQDLNLRPFGPESEPWEFAPVHTDPHPIANIVKTEAFEASHIHTASQEVHPDPPSLSRPCPRESSLTPERFLTVGQVAESLGVCRATVYRLVELGRLPHLRMVNGIRIRLADLDLLRQERAP